MLAVAAALQDSAQLLAGTTDGGVFRSGDAGETWQPWSEGLSEGLEERLIFSLAWEGPEGVALAGTLTSIHRRAPGETWSRVSSSPPGPIYELVFDPRSPSTAYAGTDSSGVYRSTDGGRTWSAAGLSGQLIRSLVFDASGRLWATTNSGIHRSDNGGSSWMSRNPDLGGTSATFNAVGADPDDGNRLWAVALGRLFRTVDGGGSWNQIPAPLLGPANTIWVRPGEPMSLDIALGGALGGVARTVDGGATWILDLVDVGELMFPEPAGPTSPLPGCFAIARTPGALLAATERGVFRLPDGGDRWLPSSAGLAAQDVMAIEIEAGGVLAATSDGLMYRTDESGRWRLAPSNSGISVPESFYALDADPSSAAVWAAAGTGAYRSVDGGAIWQRFFAAQGLLHSTRSVAVAAGGVPLVGTFLGGVYRSLDQGASWQTSNSGLSNLTIRALAVDPADPGTVWAGTDAGLFRSLDSGASWSPTTGSIGAAAVLSLAVGSSDLVLAGTGNGRIHRSTDRGATWAEAHSASGSAPVTALAADPAGTSFFAATESGEVLTGSALGATWMAAPGSPLPAPIRSLRFSDDGRSIFAGLSGRSVLRLDLVIPDRVSPVAPGSPAPPPRVVPPR